MNRAGTKRKAGTANDDKENIAGPSSKQTRVDSTTNVLSNKGQLKHNGNITVRQLREMIDQNDHLTGIKHLTVSTDRSKPADDWNDTVRHIPSLTHLTIENCPKFPIEKFCDVNPQLERLELENSTDWCIDGSLLKSLDEKLPLLKHLKVEFCYKADGWDYGGPERFKNLKTLDIWNHGQSFSRALAFINASSKELQTLEICVNGSCKRIIDDDFVEQVSTFKKLKDLIILSWLDDNKVNQLVDRMPSVEALKFLGGNVTSKSVQNLMTKCKKVCKIEIAPGCKAITDRDVQNFCKPLKTKKYSDVWKVGENDEGIITIEKKSKT